MELEETAPCGGEPISSRSVALNQLFLGQGSSALSTQHLLSRETLLDALFVLYEECSREPLRRDKNVSIFIEKFRSIVVELSKLRVNINDFEVKKVIGRGHFGDVQVVREKQTGSVYAMKILRKSSTLSQQNVAFYEEERDIMAKANSPWITQLQYAFQDRHNLYLVMHFHPGGDLFALLERHDNVLSEDMAKFYLAEMVLAIHALHNMGYVHRDIKPDNVLIDRTGHIKLADFGSAAKLSSHNIVTSQMPVGTPDYIAPEVLAMMERCRGSYGRACDWWSLGIVAYEMLYGQTPFTADKAVVTYSNIMNYKEKLIFPEFEDDDTTDEAKSLIRGLLTDENTRLGFEELSKHPFFFTVDWGAIRDQPPPFVPTVTREDDTSNFEEFEPISYKPDLTLSSKVGFTGVNLPFVGFTFCQPCSVLDNSSSSDSHRNLVRKSFLISERQLNSARQEINEMLQKINLLEKQNSERKLELEKQNYQLSECEKERDKSTRNLSKCMAENTSLKKMLDLERTERECTEKKALDLIRDIKERWQKDDKRKFDAISQENDELKDFINELNGKYKDSKLSFLSLQKELSATQKTCDFIKNKMRQYKEKVLEKRRSSTGERLQVEVVQQQASETRKRLQETENKLLASEALCLQLQQELAVQKSKQEDMGKMFDMQKENLEKEAINFKDQTELLTRKLNNKISEMVIKNNEIKELQNSLHTAEFKVAKLELQIQELTNASLNKASTASVLKAPTRKPSLKQVKLMTRVQELENEMIGLKRENERLEQDLLTAQDSDTDKSQTVEMLQAAIERLEQDFKSLTKVKCEKLPDTNDELNNTLNHGRTVKVDRMNENPESSLQKAQISKLEVQLEKCQEVVAAEKQTARELRKELFNTERELKNVKIDLRIATREAKATAEQLADLQVKETNLEMEKAQADDRIVGLTSRVAEMEEELNDKTRKYEAGLLAWEAEKIILEERIHNLESSCNEMKNVRSKLDHSEGRANEVLRRLKVLEEQVKSAEECKRRAQNCEDEMRKQLQEEKLHSEDLEAHLAIMRQVNATMDDQLQDMQLLLENSEAEEAHVKDELQKERETVRDLQDELEQMKASVLREKSKLETTLKVKEDLEHQLELTDVVRDTEMQAIIDQRNEYKVEMMRMTQELGLMEGSLVDAEADVENLRKRINLLAEENVRIKEEVSVFITQNQSLRDTNFKLTRGVEEALAEGDSLKNKICELENALQKAEATFQIERVKFEETISQQTKLVNFLQTSIETMGKKKKTFGEKLFGKKDSSPSNSNALKKSQLKVRLASPVLAMRHEFNDAKVCGTVSPTAQSVLTTLSQSPGLQESPDRPSSQRGVPMASSERMHHSIPHRFEISMNLHPTKCAACLGSVQFGRNVARCEECHISAHPKCSADLPNACSLPMGLMQQFRHSMRTDRHGRFGVLTNGTGASGDGMVTYDLEGWMKVSKNGTQGWERYFARLKDKSLALYHPEAVGEHETPDMVMNLCPLDETLKVVEAVLPAELSWPAKSDLPYIFKVELQPLTTCWPGKCLYILCSTFEDKLSWVSFLEKAIKPAGNIDDHSHYSELVSFKNASDVDLNCICYLDYETVVIGAEEGLYLLDLLEVVVDQPKVHITGFGPVAQLYLVKCLEMLVVIAGNNRRLSWIKLPTLKAVFSGEIHLMADVIQSLQPVENITSCHMFIVYEGDDSVHVCAGTATELFLLRWNPGMKTFCLRKRLKTVVPCSCALFTSNSVIVGTDKFYEIDLQNFSVEDFLDESDPSLADVRLALLELQSFPLGIFQVAPQGVKAEYLLCFHEFGVFIDGFGQRTRKDNIHWSGLPLTFSFTWPYLYVVHFNSVAILEIIVHVEKCYSVQTFVNVTSPRYLGSGLESGTIILATSKDQKVDVLCLNGEAAIAKKTLKTTNDEHNRERMVSEELNSLGEFSFTSSVLEAIDQPDAPTAQESSV